MDRPELRFRILFEYYQELHSENPAKYDSREKIQKIPMPDHEKRAAQTWLIDREYVDGTFHGQYGTPVPIPLIGRINSDGVDFVERVMDAAFTEIENDFSVIKELSKGERIKKFTRECLKSGTARDICKATLDAIMTYMPTA